MIPWQYKYVHYHSVTHDQNDIVSYPARDVRTVSPPDAVSRAAPAPARRAMVTWSVLFTLVAARVDPKEYALRFEGASSVAWRSTGTLKHALADGVKIVATKAANKIAVSAVCSPSAVLAMEFLDRVSIRPYGPWLGTGSMDEPEELDFVIQDASLTLNVSNRTFDLRVMLAARAEVGWWIAPSSNGNPTCRQRNGVLKCEYGGDTAIYFERKPGFLNHVYVSTLQHHQLLPAYSQHALAFDVERVVGPGRVSFVGNAFDFALDSAHSLNPQSVSFCEVATPSPSAAPPGQEDGKWQAGSRERPHERMCYWTEYNKVGNPRNNLHSTLVAKGTLTLTMDGGEKLSCAGFTIDQHAFYFGMPGCAWREVAVAPPSPSTQRPISAILAEQSQHGANRHLTEMAYLCDCGHDTMALKVVSPPNGFDYKRMPEYDPGLVFDIYQSSGGG